MTKLPHPVTPRDHAPLTTLEEACAYMLALPKGVAQWNAWNSAAGLAMAAKARPGRAAIDAFTRQLEAALFMTGRLDVEAAENAKKPRPARQGRARV